MMQISSGGLRAEVYSITYRLSLTDAQQFKLDRKWPDGTPFITYEKIDSLLEPLQVENVYWFDHTGKFLYFTVYGDDKEGTAAEVLERLAGKLGTA